MPPPIGGERTNAPNANPSGEWRSSQPGSQPCPVATFGAGKLEGKTG